MVTWAPVFPRRDHGADDNDQIVHVSIDDGFVRGVEEHDGEIDHRVGQVESMMRRERVYSTIVHEEMPSGIPPMDFGIVWQEAAQGGNRHFQGVAQHADGGTPSQKEETGS